VLGFDESIDDYCQRNRGHVDYSGQYHAHYCVNSNLNILSLFSDRVPYNTCRNLEWQICAAQGLVPGQGDSGIVFAHAPNKLNYEGSRLAHCKGYRPDNLPKDCSDGGFATDSIFFLEVCVFNQLCANAHELWRLEVGEPFYCDLRTKYFYQLREMLETAPQWGGSQAAADSQHDQVNQHNQNNQYNQETADDFDDNLTPCTGTMNALYAQCGGNGWTGSSCCPAHSQCEGGEWYRQCRPH